VSTATERDEGEGGGSERPSGKIRVAYCLDSFDVGGTELNAVRTIEHLDRSRFEVSFISLSGRGPLADRVRTAGVPIHVFRLENFFSLKGLRLARALARHLRAERIEILHAHDIYSNIFAVPVARMAGVPLVIASRRWWHAANRRIYLALNRLTYRLAHRVLANADSVGRLLEEEGVPSHRVAVVPNFVEGDAFVPPGAAQLQAWRATFGLPADAEVVGIVANLHAVKDHASLLRALPAILAARPRVRLVLVGDGAERTRLEETARELGVHEHVIFAGRQPSRPTLHWLFDVSVLCSTGEGFPNSVVEAMAAARPVVATRVGGIPDVVVDGVTGYLVPPSTPDALAKRIAQLLADPNLRSEMGTAGARRAREAFHASQVLARLESLYESVRHVTQVR